MFRKVIQRGIHYVIILGLTFSLLETLSRILLPVKARLYGQYSQDFLRKPYPYIMFKGQPLAAFANGERLNKFGYRGKSPDLPKEAGEFRIFVIGGSTVFFGEPTISDLLEKEFHKAGNTQVQCYNFGVVSSVSTQDLVRVLLELVDFKPNLIVMYNGGNDIFSPLFIDPRPGYPYNFIVYENNPLLKTELSDYPLIPLLAFGSNVIRILKPSYFLDKFVPMEKTKTEAGFLTEKWREKIIITYFQNMMKAAKISRNYGAEFYVFFQPSAYYKKSYTATEAKNLRMNENPDLFKDSVAFAKDMQNRVRTVFQQKPSDLNFVDLSDIFLNDPNDVFKDTLHIYEGKNMAIAKAIYQSLKSAMPQETP